MSEAKVLLCQGLQNLGIALNDHQVSQLLGYTKLLQQWNQVHNFTKEKTFEAIIKRHILNSLAAYALITKGPCMDVGTGPGLPGIPLAIALPHLDWDLIESRQKRVSFLTHCCRQLDLKNVHPHPIRIEAFTCSRLYQTIIARAFCQPEEYMNQIKHCLSPEGQALLMVGQQFVLDSGYGSVIEAKSSWSRIWQIKASEFLS